MCHRPSYPRRDGCHWRLSVQLAYRILVQADCNHHSGAGWVPQIPVRTDRFVSGTADALSSRQADPSQTCSAMRAVCNELTADAHSMNPCNGLVSDTFAPV